MRQIVFALVAVEALARVVAGLRARRGDNLAMMAFRERTLPFPDGAIIAAIPRNYVSSEENNKIFGHDSGQQSRGPEPRSWT